MVSFLKKVRIVLLVPFVVLLCPTVFLFEYLVCHNPQLVDDAQPILLSIRRVFTLSPLSITILVLVLPALILMAPFVPAFLVGGALVWLLKERMPKLKERSFKALLVFNKVSFCVVIIAMLVLIAPAISISVHFKLQVWNVVLYEVFPAMTSGWNRHIYSLLDASKKEIRLIEILPGSKADGAECRLISRTWDTSRYEALS
jgi:hypothetical protein